MKRCTVCGEDKQLDCFYSDASRPRGYMARCKECDCRVGRERYAKKIGRAPRSWGLSKKKLCLDCGTPTTNGAQRCWGCYTASRIRDRRTPCKVEGCSRPVGEHGKAGYCSPHYQRKKRYGDPLYIAPPKPRKAKPLPPTHIKLCACGESFSTSHPRRARCDLCIASGIRYRDWKAESRRRYGPPKPCARNTCGECGTPFLSNRPNALYCCKGCAARASRARRRVAKRDAFREQVFRADIYERDGWKCQLCGTAVDRRSIAPNGSQGALRESIWAPTIDHIIPLSCGGTHEPANVQTAHFICNSKKSAHGCGSQLLCFG